MRVLIADDERLARVTVRSMIEEIDSDTTVIEAVNGKDLVEKSMQFIPHIVIVDIQMPLVNGLDAIRRAKERLPMTKWIILTGFAQFDYAKEAILLHAYAYLLKPVPVGQLRDVMHQAHTEIMREIAAGNAAFEQRLHSFLQLPEQVKLAPCHYQAATLETARDLDDNAPPLSQVVSVAQKILATEFDIVAKCAVIPLDESSCCIVCSAGERKILSERFFAVLEKIHCRFACSLWVAYDDIIDRFEDLAQSLERCRQTCSLKAFLPPSRCINTSILQTLAEIDALSSISERVSEAVENRRKGKTIFAKELMESAVTEAMGLHEPNRAELYHFLCFLHRYARSEYRLPFGRASYEQVKNDLNGFLDLLHDSCSPQVNDIISYIHNHYNEPISVKSIASVLQISPNYLSAKFKQETGKRFSEYLCLTRMEQAKLRLLHTQMHVHEIANAVGIHDVRYFSDIFRKHVGCTPSEFRIRNPQ